MSDSPAPITARSIFSQGSYARFWFARICSTVAFQMTAVAVGWQLYALTHSTFALGMAGLAQFLPMLLLTLVTGQTADRFNRKNINTICQTTEATAMIVLALSSHLGWLHPAGIYTAVAAIGACRAFEGPSTQALLPGLIPENMLPTAIAWSASANQTASIVGPALGGLLYALGATVPYAACAALFATASMLSFSLVSSRRTPPRTPVTLDSLFSGIRYIAERKNILGAISLDLFAVLLGGATALLPAYARDILHTGPWGLGLLRLAPAIGALSTSIFLAHNPIRRQAGRRMFLAVIVFGLATVSFAFSRSIWLSMAILSVLGAADVVSVVVRSSLVQLETPDAMRGRVSAVNSLFIGTSNQLGEFESGLTASWFGIVPATVIGGIGSIAVALIWMGLFPGLRRLETLSANTAPAVEPETAKTTP
ncbi:Predicted arabinose efflux permease, MFS family [Granulicella rosea]|uniref:Predicted arabinose efflux permease, MFS family n=1 Tax=Granulicella rosea TaxID=474952 RepID=A0A239E0X7_9BACT|nr:MFS transporter [Granulicella rosea]SNS37643.1 Predicted arabinose efflux permease, MFS family [Granulicella rosea]